MRTNFLHQEILSDLITWCNVNANSNANANANLSTVFERHLYYWYLEKPLRYYYFDRIFNLIKNKPKFQKVYCFLFFIQQVFAYKMLTFVFFLIIYISYWRKKIYVSCVYHMFQNKYLCMLYKLDGVGPLDNGPSTNKLHHFVQKKEENESDMWHVTRDTWHVTWHVTHEIWHVWWSEHSLKISAL